MDFKTISKLNILPLLKKQFTIKIDEKPITTSLLEIIKENNPSTSEDEINFLICNSIVKLGYGLSTSVYSLVQGFASSYWKARDILDIILTECYLEISMIKEDVEHPGFERHLIIGFDKFTGGEIEGLTDNIFSKNNEGIYTLNKNYCIVTIDFKEFYIGYIPLLKELDDSHNFIGNLSINWDFVLSNTSYDQYVINAVFLGKDNLLTESQIKPFNLNDL